MSAPAPFAPGRRIRSILEDAATLTGLPVRQLLGGRRVQHLAFTRFAVMWAAQQGAGKSTLQIGHVLGGRDHTTVSRGIQRAEQLRAEDRDFAALTDELLRLDAERDAA